MKRNVTELSNKVYDLLIIGGGIYGSAVAWDAALRGLSVALIDKGDFGSRNSSNSQKTIHGGLRYMQHGDLWRMRVSACERAIFMRIAPHLVHPMACVVPIRGHLMKSVMPLALRIYDFVSLNRNQLKDPQKHIPNGKIVSKEECLRLIPGMHDDGLTGGIIWYDAQVYNTERMVLSFVTSAKKAGAQVANYVEAIDLLKDENRIKIIKAKDLLNNSELKIKAKVVLNASGPWVDKVSNMLKNRNTNKTYLSKMMVLVVNRLFVKDYAFGISFKKKFKDNDAVVNKGYRILFISPWRNHSLIGTAQLSYEGDPEDFEITDNDIQMFIEEINEAYPDAAISRKDISFYYGGLLPIDEINSSGDINLIKHHIIFDHQKDGIDGLISIVSVKYTEGRHVAQEVTDLVFKKLGIKSPKCTTMETPLKGGFIERFDDFLKDAIERRPQGVSEEIVKHLVYNYGSEYPEIFKYLNENRCWGEKISDALCVIKAEILHGIREEMAYKLSDIILRRTEMGTTGYPGDDVLEDCANIMAEELSWNESKIQDELKEVREIYKINWII